MTCVGIGYILNAYALMHWVINRNFYWSLRLQFNVSKIVRWAPAPAPGPPPAPNGQFCIPNGYIASIFSAQGPRIYLLAQFSGPKCTLTIFANFCCPLRGEE